MLDSNLKDQLRTYLERVTQPIELVASLDDRPASAEMKALLEDVAALSDKISVRLDGTSFMTQPCVGHFEQVLHIFAYLKRHDRSTDRKSTRLNSSHRNTSRMPSSA